MDHQWGGWDVPTSPTKPEGGGWRWFEFQFDGNRALTLSCTHSGKIVPSLWGFGVYVEGTSSMLVEAKLDVGQFAKSPETDANSSQMQDVAALIPSARQCGPMYV